MYVHVQIKTDFFFQNFILSINFLSEFNFFFQNFAHFLPLFIILYIFSYVQLERLEYEIIQGAIVAKMGFQHEKIFVCLFFVLCKN